MDKLIRTSLQLQKLNKIHNISQTNEFKELMKCFPLRFDAEALMKKFPKHISVRTLYSQNDLRLSVYCLPQRISMPIHDHPKMFVVSHVLTGEIQAKLYTKLAKDSYKKETQLLKTGESIAIEGDRHNLHEMTGVQNSIFIDIIFPDYNFTDRVCTHYKEIPNSAQKDIVKLQIWEDPDYEMDQF